MKTDRPVRLSESLLAAAATLLLMTAHAGAAEPAASPALLEAIQRSCASRQFDPGHGFVVLPVARAILAVKEAIPEIRAADPELVQVTALLHDIGGGGPRGEVSGPPKAREVLAEQKCAPEFIERVCRIIATHHHLHGELVKGLDDTPEWFVVIVADRPQVIAQHQRAPTDEKALTALVKTHIATLKRNLSWVEAAPKSPSTR